MAKVSVEARPTGRFKGSAVGGYVVVDRANILLATFTAQADAIGRANKALGGPRPTDQHLIGQGEAEEADSARLIEPLP
jgi:hypothetical protein